MNILVLAPHPFFQNRGTPIDVLLVLRVLALRKNTNIDLLVYNEGDEVQLPNLKTYRTPSFKFAHNIRPGFSFKKLIVDFAMFICAWRLVASKRYDIIHAGEEAVFFAIFFKIFYKIPYAYDLDSSIAQQMIEKYPSLKLLSSVFNLLESKAIKHSMVNLPVCNALAELCRKNGSKMTVTLHDISQLKNPSASPTGKLKKELSIKGMVMLYIGNLEIYQGIDLLLKSFALATKKTESLDLVIIGGVEEDIKRYSIMARNLGIERRVHFTGPKPFEQLDEYLSEADILVAPRIKGINTPMKVFPYLHSGKPVLLTDLYTHNQIISRKEAFLSPANEEGFSKSIVRLAKDEKLRKRLGHYGREFVEKNHTFSAHSKRLNNVYDWIERELNLKN